MTKLQNVEVEADEISFRSELYIYVTFDTFSSSGVRFPIRLIAIDCNSPGPIIYSVWGLHCDVFQENLSLDTLLDGQISSYKELPEAVENIVNAVRAYLRPEYLKSPLEALLEDHSD
jgi:hypothetical protein